MSSPPSTPSRTAEVRAWTDAGMDRLTGPADGPGLGPPEGFVVELDELTGRIARASAALGTRVDVDGLGLLTERAAIAGHRRRGRISCGGATRLLETGDGWVAASLARPEDRDLVPAWLGTVTGPDTLWDPVAEACSRLTTREVVERAVLLGLPVAQLPAVPGTVGPSGTGDPAGRPPLPTLPGVHPTVDATGTTWGRAAPDRGPDRGTVRVADLSGLWAGPLCGRILADAGAEVLKVESAGRPDGARSGPPEFFRRLNGSKGDVTVDLGSGEGVAALRRLLCSVDVVIESSRPRGLQQLGINAEELLARPDGPTTWVSITGHGRTGPDANRVAFGDDAAVAGGLVAWAGGTPWFCGDAIADPLAGLTAAAATLEALGGDGGSVLLDIPLRAVAAHFAGPTCPIVEPPSGGRP